MTADMEMRKNMQSINAFYQTHKEESWLFASVLTMFLPGFVCVVAVGATACAILLHREMRRRLAAFPHGIWLLLWGTLTLATMIVYRNGWGLLFSLFFYALILFFAYYHVVMTEQLCQKVFRSVTVLGVAVFIVALFEKIVIKGRVSATFYNPNYYGYICEMLILVGIYAWFQDRSWRWPYAVGVAVNILGVLLAGCYFAWLAALAGIVVLLFCLKRCRAAFILLGAAIFYGVISYFFPQIIPTTHDLVQNIEYRILIWKKAGRYFIAHPLFGNGLLTFFFISKGMPRPLRAHAHNLLLDIFLNYGVAGTVLLGIFGVYWIVRLVRNRRMHASCSMCLGICTASIVHGLIDVPLIGFQSAALFFLFMALAVTDKPAAIRKC